MDKSNTNVTIQEVVVCIQQDSQNNKCFDCDEEMPMCASVNNGVMICQDCAAKHKETLGGAYYSKIRNINTDNWNRKNLRMMEEGGNSKLREFLASFDLDQI